MSLKRLRLPTQLSYPLRITETHVAAGQSVAKGDPIYTLEDATGRRGMMRAPSAGKISEGPVEAGASFSEPTPVVGMVVESPVETEPSIDVPATENHNPDLNVPPISPTEEQSQEKKPFGWLLILLVIAGFVWGQTQIKLQFLEGWNPLIEVLVSVLVAGVFFVAVVLALSKPNLVTETQAAALWFPLGILAMVIAFVPAREVARWGFPSLNSAQHIESDYSSNGQQVSNTARAKNDVTKTQSSKVGSENSVMRQTNNSRNASPISPDELGTRDFSDSFASINSDAPLSWVNTAAHPDRHRNRAHAFIVHGSQRVAGPFDQAYWQDPVDPKTNETRNFVVGMCDTSDPENGMWVKLIRGLTLEVLKSWKGVCLAQAGALSSQGQPSITLTHNFRDIRYSDNQQTTLFKHDNTVIDAETFEELHSFTLPNSTLCSFDSRVRGSNPSMCRD